jgi:uncharacterized membrane protein YdjX (TVP38/TMEM64 family)
MRELIRPLLIITLALLVPIVPFLAFGDSLEAMISQQLDPPPSALVVAALTVAILASDILLPVPSSLVSTIAGAQLGIVAGTAASWLGMTLGAVLGFCLARFWGRGLVAWLCKPEDVARLDLLGERYGSGMLIMTRALPVLAEAAVLLTGVARMRFRRFFLIVALGNLGIALVYSVLGQLARSQGELPLAMGASIALPLLATTIARRRLR